MNIEQFFSRELFNVHCSIVIFHLGKSPCYHLRIMAVNPDLLKILVCPLCKAPVNLTDSGLGLKCTACHRVYPIRDDIPVMLVNEATIEN